MSVKALVVMMLMMRRRIMTAMGITSAKMTVMTMKMTIASSDDKNCIQIFIMVCSTHIIDMKAGYII